MREQERIAMQCANRQTGPFCTNEIADLAPACLHGGRDLHSMKIAYSNEGVDSRPYEVVPDGFHYGVAFAGEIRIHGLDRVRAVRLMALLNSVSEIKDIG
jgi:hypothetical protein